MSVHEFLAPVIIPSLVHFDPLGLQEEAEESLAGDEPFGRIDERCFFHSLREMPWLQPLQQFCESVGLASPSHLVAGGARRNGTAATGPEDRRLLHQRTTGRPLPRRTSFSLTGTRSPFARRRRCSGSSENWRDSSRR